MADKKNAVTRQQVEDKLDEGCHVGIGSAIVKRDRFGGTSHNLDEFFPNERATQEATIVRDPAGRLTREGMEHIIKHGSSVMLSGEVFSSVDELPSQERIDKIREEEGASAEKALDHQIKLLAMQRERVSAKDADANPKFGPKRAHAAADDTDDDEYEDTTKDVLLDDARHRGLEGITSASTKDDIIKALRKDDAGK